MEPAAESAKERASDAASGLEAAAIGGAHSYRMFDVGRLDEGGAFLAGPLLFEVGEVFVLELRGGGDRVSVRARVVRVDRGEPAGVEVELIDVSDGERSTLDRLRALPR